MTATAAGSRLAGALVLACRCFSLAAWMGCMGCSRVGRMDGWGGGGGLLSRTFVFIVAPPAAWVGTLGRGAWSTFPAVSLGRRRSLVISLPSAAT